MDPQHWLEFCTFAFPFYLSQPKWTHSFSLSQFFFYLIGRGLAAWVF
jgi:hypothetical protein